MPSATGRQKQGKGKIDNQRLLPRLSPIPRNQVYDSCQTLSAEQSS